LTHVRDLVVGVLLTNWTIQLFFYY